MSDVLLWPTSSMKIAAGGEYNNDRGPNHSPRFHQGCDIAIGVGTSIYASGDGAVTAVINTGTASGYGLYVKVRYAVAGLTIDVINSHMSRVDVRVGQAVAAGTLLGVSGGAHGSFGAGDATGPHDHLEIRVNGILHDPHDYLFSRSQGASSGNTVTPVSPASPLPTTSSKDDDMPNYIVLNSGNDNNSFAVGQRLVQDPVTGIFRALADGEFGLLQKTQPGIIWAEWSPATAVNYASRLGLREYETIPGVRGGVGKLTGRIIYPTS